MGHTEGPRGHTEGSRCHKYQGVMAVNCNCWDAEDGHQKQYTSKGGRLRGCDIFRSKASANNLLKKVNQVNAKQL